MQHRLSRGLKTGLIAASLFAATFSPFIAAPVTAQGEKQLPLVVEQTTDGVRIDYASAKGSLPIIQLGDLLVPGRQVLVEMTSEVTKSALQAEAQRSLAVQSTAFNGELQIAKAPITQAGEGTAAGDIQRELMTTLPDSPVTLVNEGMMRGRRFATIAITPLYEQAGQRMIASAFTAVLPNAKLIEDPTNLMSDFSLDKVDSNSKMTAQAASPSVCVNSDPANGMLADGQARWRIRVSQEGIVQVSFSALNGAHMPVSPMVGLQLKNKAGTKIAIQYIDQNVNGLFDVNDSIRFYAPRPGDRWNQYDTYWLTLNSSNPSPEMATQSEGLGAGAAATTGLERGVYVSNKFYDSTLPGTDGDHWFAANLRPFKPNNAIWTFTPPTRLPPTPGNTKVDVSFASSTDVKHALQLATNGTSNFVSPTNTSIGRGAFVANFQIANFTGLSQLIARYIVNDKEEPLPEVIMPDRVEWEQPVFLNLGGNGAAFAVNGAAVNVQMNGAPAETLYNITSPTMPVKVTHSNGLFRHVGGERSYVMAGNGTPVTNASISQYAPVAMDTKFNKNAVYIAPNALLSTLDLYLIHRNTQGAQAGSFSAESIYDWWSFGQMSPAAIRNFLRYAYCNWSTKPIGVTMIGDGSADPFDYNGYNTGQYAGTNVTLIPPYLAPVDPFLVPASLGAAETACESCYAQLDGANPLDDKIPDLLFGRIPAKNSTELNTVLGKVYNYETAPVLVGDGDLAWRNVIAYANDNARMPNGTYDPAGNFENATETSISEQPSWARIKRVYYDPYSNVTNAERTNIPDAAFNRTFSLFNTGAGIVNYTGHGSIIQMAVLDTNLPDATKTYLFSFYDVPDLKNTSRLPLLLQFTCLTSAFQTSIQFYGTTVDERLVLSSNGPPAIWGPTSLGVSFSHEALMRGFYKTLWSQPRYGSTVGFAAQGGYLELFASSGGAPNVDNLLRTYLIMGDPLTKAYVGQVPQTGLPITIR